MSRRRASKGGFTARTAGSGMWVSSWHENAPVVYHHKLVETIHTTHVIPWCNTLDLTACSPAAERTRRRMVLDDRTRDDLLHL
jgi:hypothetical protein